jgi:hypothetical protein
LLNGGRIDPYQHTYAERLPKPPALRAEIEVHLVWAA